MKYEALRKEIDGMLSAVPGDWSVETVSVDAPGGFMTAVVARDKTAIMLLGAGRTKAEALGKLLENWRKGQSEPYAPAAGSLAELRLKLAVREG